MPPSQEYRDPLFVAQDNRENFKQIIAKRSDLAKFNGGRMDTSALGVTTTYYAGTVLGQETSGPQTGQFRPYNSTNTDGSQVAVGILAEDAIMDPNGDGSEISILVGGIVFKDYLIGLDAGAITALKATSLVEHGTNLLSF